VVLFDACGQTLLALGGADSGLDVGELFLGSLDLVVGPSLEAVALLLEVAVVGFERGRESGVGVAPALGREPLRGRGRRLRRHADTPVAAEQPLATLLVQHLALVSHGREQQVLLTLQ